MSDSIMDLPLFEHASKAYVVDVAARNLASESESAQEILSCLKTGPLGTSYVESRWHRGQAAIGRLRDEGHIIHTKQRTYVYEGFQPGRVKVTRDLQELYYRTTHWKQTALARKQIDGFACTRCGSTSELETHHWTYNLFNESMDELETFCRGCHEWIHELVKGSSVHFPRYVDAKIADRIRTESAS